MIAAIIITTLALLSTMALAATVIGVDQVARKVTLPVAKASDYSNSVDVARAFAECDHAVTWPDHASGHYPTIAPPAATATRRK